MFEREELEILRRSLSKLVDNRIPFSEDTRLLQTNLGLSVHGCTLIRKSPSDLVMQKHLSKFEIQRFTKFKHDGRRMQYYVGRVLAKRCLQDVWERDSIKYQEITVKNDSEGRPFFNFKDSEVSFEGAASISHKGEYLVAACIREGDIGLDIEKQTSHSGLARRIAKNHTEMDISRITNLMMKSHPDFNLKFAHTAIWSALEAGYKATSSLQSKSPLEFKLSVERERITVAPLTEQSLLGIPVFFVHNMDYLLTLAVQSSRNSRI